jgi:hypothetical protein
MEQRKLVLHQREQVAIARMVELRSQGFTFEQIAQSLNTLGVVTKTGRGKWHRKTVQAILSARADDRLAQRDPPFNLPSEISNTSTTSVGEFSET